MDGKINRAAAKAAGYTDAEIDAYLAQQAAAPSPMAGRARAAIQGATFGLGEEAEALARSLLPGGRSYGEEVGRIRGEMEAYRQARPKEALAVETAGGMMVPGLGALKLGKAALTGGRMARAATSAVGSGAIQGALTGAGTTEGGLGERTFGALAGGAAGGLTGGVVGGLTSAASRGLSRGRATIPAGISTTAKTMQQAGMSPQDLAARAASAAPGATMADILGEPAIRTLRGIRAAGGRAGAEVSQAMEERAATSPQRLRQSLYGGRPQENIVAEIEASIGRGEAASKPLYKAFERQAPKEIAEVDEILSRPIGQAVMERARKIAQNDGRQFIEPAVPARASEILDEFGRPVMTAPQAAKYNPRSLDDIKKAMDALIYEGRLGRVEPGQGGILPGELNVAKNLRRQFVEAVDQAYPETYARARQEWAGEFALRDALEEGSALASRRSLTPEVIQKMAREYQGSEMDALQRGFIDGMRQRIENGQLGYREIGTEAFLKRMQAILGDQEGERVVNAFRAEGQLMRAANVVRGGSQTAEKLEDVANVGGMGLEGILGQGGVRRAMYAGGREAIRRIAAPFGEQRRMEAAQALLTRPARVQDLLDALGAEARRQERGRVIGQVLGGVAARETSGKIARESNLARSY
jgi:hypothetical protein